MPVKLENACDAASNDSLGNTEAQESITCAVAHPVPPLPPNPTTFLSLMHCSQWRCAYLALPRHMTMTKDWVLGLNNANFS